MFSAIWAQINDWVNNGEAGDLRHHRVHYDVIVNITENSGISDAVVMYLFTHGVIFLQLYGINHTNDMDDIYKYHRQVTLGMLP